MATRLRHILPLSPSRRSLPGSAGIVASWVLAVLALATAPCGASEPTPTPSLWLAAGIDDPEPSRQGDRVLLIGSSSMRGNLGRTLASAFERLGFESETFAVSASGVSRPDFFDWQAKVAELPIDGDTAAVLIYVGVNDPQGIWLRPEERAALHARDAWVRWQEARWLTVYRDRMAAWIDAICDKGARRVIVLTPADVRWTGLQERLRRVRRAQILAARKSRCGRAVSTSGDLAFLREPDPDEPARRMPDGYHMSTPGAEIVWRRIAPHLLRLVGGIPAADDVVQRRTQDEPGT